MNAVLISDGVSAENRARWILSSANSCPPYSKAHHRLSNRDGKKENQLLLGAGMADKTHQDVN